MALPYSEVSPTFSLFLVWNSKLASIWFPSSIPYLITKTNLYTNDNDKWQLLPVHVWNLKEYNQQNFHCLSNSHFIF